MTVRECYARIGNYDEAIMRLGSEAYIRKYLGKFCKDGSFAALCEAMAQSDAKGAFFCVHNLKGLYLNLAMSHAGLSASRLCEALRGGELSPEVYGMMEDLKKEHEKVLDTLAVLLELDEK